MRLSRFSTGLGLAASCGVLALALQQTFGTPQPPDNSSNDRNSDFVDTIIELGSVKGANDIVISSSFPEPMVILSVANDMAEVRKGEVILTVDDSKQRDSLDKARAALAEATSLLSASNSEAASLDSQVDAVQKLRDLKKELGQTIIASAKAESDSLARRGELLKEQLERQIKLYTYYKDAIDSREFSALSLFEKLQIQTEAINAETHAAEIRLEIAKISKSCIEQPMLEAAVHAAELSLDGQQHLDDIHRRMAAVEHQIETAEEQLRNAGQAVAQSEEAVTLCAIRAPRDGIVAHVPSTNTRGAEPLLLKPGTRIPPGAELFRMPDMEHFQVEGRLNSAKTARVRPGQSVVVVIDALPDMQLAGQVKSIAAEPSPGAWPNTDLREFPFVVQLDPESMEKAKGFLKNGLTCTIQIDLKNK